MIAFEPTFIEVRHVETGALVQIMPSAHTRCLFADTPPSRVNAPVPPNRQLMYGKQQPQQQMRQPPNQPGFRPPPPGAGGGAMRPPPMGFGPPQGGPGGPQGSGMPPPPPQQTRYARSQVIFTSDDGHVQFLKFPPAPTPGLQRPVHGSRSSH